MKFSWRQLIASAGGAVLAAVIASFFGVKGTVIGVAIGSAAATVGTSLVAQSIERGHEAVKQVAVRVPDRTGLLRRLGSTATVGEVEAPTAETTVPSDETTVVERPADDTVAVPAVAAAVDVTEPVAVSEPVTAEMHRPVISRHSVPWKAISATAAAVFVLALGVVTGIELLAGHSLADLFGHGNSGSTVGGLINPGTSPTTSTTTTSTSTTTTTSTSTTTTTSTTVPGGSTTTTAPGSTTTTVPSSTTTTTSGLGGLFGTTTTTSHP